jgi:hypothetical protein
MFQFAEPELVIYILPVLAGILAGKYVGRVANFCIMLAVFQVGLFILASASSGELRPRFLLPIIFVWPPLSAGQFIPPLVFVLASIIIYRVRYAVQ